jgi:hypothetical protein
MDYFLLDQEIEAPFCTVCDEPDDVRKLRPPSIGEPSASWWPTDPPFKMGRDPGHGIVPGDFVANVFRYLMVSARARALFEEMVPDPIEYLPFKIVNHKDAVLKETFYVANVLASVPAVDLAKSQGRPDALYPTFFDLFRDLHLDMAQIPPERRLFRLAPFPQKILVHQAVKEEIEKRKLTGAVFLPPSGRVR